MCGVSGILSFAEPPDAALVMRMMGRMRHRGPDGSGYYRDERVALGHVRLAIIDTAGGAQPMCNEDGSVWITFNGEIFNYLELRAQLADRGHVFRTASDTEVVVHAWEEWGAGCFARFNGQWALALWDRRTRRLVLSRDRLGVRPLFFVRGRDRVLFASEVKSLFADPDVRRALDPAGLAETLTFWSTVAPRTVFEGVEQLEPGHVAVFQGRSMTKAPYWTPDFPARGHEPSQDIAVNEAELRERLIEAARLRFVRSDVPVGAYLSGGIDSAITAAVVAEHTDVPLQTFSVRFSEAEFDEGAFQSEVVRRLGTDHHDIVVTPADIAEIFPEVVRYTETPLLRSAPAPMFLLSRLVREHGYKVVVTGEGADEVLAGYDIFREAQVRLFWARGADSPTRARAVELLYPWLARSPGRAPAFAKGFFGKNLDPTDPALSHRPRWDATGALRFLLRPEVRAAADVDVVTPLLERMPAAASSWDPLSRGQWLEMMTLLPGYILSSQGDRMLMANSVEGRFPFLDREVLALANALPARHKLMGLDEKYLLKRAFRDLVPREVLDRPKQPYRAPDASSFFMGAAPRWLSTVASQDAVRDAGVFDPTVVAGLFEKCARTGGRGMSNTDNMRVLAVLSTQLVHAQLIDEGGTDQRPPEPMVAIDMLARNRREDDSYVRA